MGIKNGREGNLYARDRCAQIVAEKDRTGGAYAHLEDLTEDQWKDPHLQFCLTLDPGFFRDYRRPMRISPLEHYFCGGVVIDSFGRTSVDGLYACGEVTGGVDGANRVGGNALTNIVTFGLRAGMAAGEEVGACCRLMAAHSTGCLPSRPVPKTGNLRRELQEKAWGALGPIREKCEWKASLIPADFESRKTRLDTP